MQCEHFENKQQCKAHAMKESKFCFVHNPEVSKEEKKEAQARGGRNSGIINKNPLPLMELNEPDDVVILLAETINQMRIGQMEVTVANCIGLLSGQLIKAFEISRLNKKFESIEKIISNR